MANALKLSEIASALAEKIAAGMRKEGREVMSDPTVPQLRSEVRTSQYYRDPGRLVTPAHTMKDRPQLSDSDYAELARQYHNLSPIQKQLLHGTLSGRDSLKAMPEVERKAVPRGVYDEKVRINLGDEPFDDTIYDDYLKLQKDPLAGIKASGKELPESASYADNEADIIHNMETLFDNAIQRVSAKKGQVSVQPTASFNREEQFKNYKNEALKEMERDRWKSRPEAKWNNETESYERTTGLHGLDDREIRARQSPEGRPRAKELALEGKPADLPLALRSMKASSSPVPPGKAMGTDPNPDRLYRPGDSAVDLGYYEDATKLDDAIRLQRENVGIAEALKQRFSRGQAPYSALQTYKKGTAPPAKWTDNKQNNGPQRRLEDKFSPKTLDERQVQSNLLDIFIRKERAKLEQLEMAKIKRERQK